MKTLHLSSLTIFLLLLSQWSLAQKSKVKFGKIDLAEVQMTEYSEDPDADAVILYDKGISKIEYVPKGDVGFKLLFERHQRIKILKEAGKSWADFAIETFHSQGAKEKLRSVKAVTYNLEGETITKDRLVNSDIFEEEKSFNWTVHKFAMPNVNVGSVIELRYQIESEFFSNFQEWDFQHTIPCIWSEYVIEIPEYFIYNKNMRGYELDRLTVNKSGDRSEKIIFSDIQRGRGRAANSTIRNAEVDLRVNQNHWVTENMPAFKPEAYMLNVNDYLTGIEFELAQVKFPNSPTRDYATSWNEIGSTLEGHPGFGLLLDRKGWIKNEVAQIEASASSPEEKLAAAYALVQTKMQWDGRNRLLASSSLKKVFEAGTGSSAEINLTLILLLQALELDAVPVLVSTRSHGRINPIHPSINQFNYVVAGVQLGENIVLLDATSKKLPPGMLPVRCLNDRGRWMGASQNDWISLQGNAGNGEVAQLVLALGEEGQLTGSLKLALKNYGAYHFRNKLAEQEEDGYFTNWAADHEGFSIEEHTVKNVEDLSKGIRVECKVAFEDRVEMTDDLLFFTPLLLFAREESPFKQEDRLYPVDIPYSIDEKYILKFEIPEGYRLEEVPEDLVMSLPGDAAKYSYSVKTMNNMVLVSSTFKLRKLQYLQDDYGALKTFYDMMVEKQAEQLVFKKQ